MNIRLRRLVLPAVLAAALPATAVLAQTLTQRQDEPPSGRAAPSAETRARLLDGRIAMAKEALRLNASQLQLWAPVEAQLRTGFAARQKAREERQALRQGRTRPDLPDRLERASQRMAERAQSMKAFAEAFRPFYASLSDEQKAVAGVVLRQARGDWGHRGHGRRWAMQEAPAPNQK